jgi:hypothetical protein
MRASQQATPAISAIFLPKIPLTITTLRPHSITQSIPISIPPSTPMQTTAALLHQLQLHLLSCLTASSSRAPCRCGLYTIWCHARQPLCAYHSVVAYGVVFPSLLYRLLRAGESRLAKLPVDVVVGFTHPGTEGVAGLSRRRRLADVVLYRSSSSSSSSSSSNARQGQKSVDQANCHVRRPDDALHR